MGERALVLGFGVSGQAAAAHLRRLGRDVVVADDDPAAPARRRAEALGVELVERPDEHVLEKLVGGSTLVVPSPGVPPGHPAFRLAAAAGVPVRSEVELAADAIDRPLVAVTGTNGKTTVTALVARMLEESGRRAVAAGNIGLALSEVVGRDLDVVVVEVSSFQLEFTERFRPAVAVWLNFAADHLDWHPDVPSYAAAKARIWRNQRPGDVAVVNAEDPVVMAAASRAPGRLLTFAARVQADYRCRAGRLVGPEGELAAVGELWRALPHDVADGLAAAAAALACGATVEGVRAALRGFTGLPHRLTLVAERDGVRWYDDSKATNPHAALSAVGSFPSVVLVAGGRNKGLDLSVLAPAAERVRAVVAIGEAAPEVEAVFAGLRPVRTAGSMDEAVQVAGELARPGDAVLLSPACASFDWYRSYAERGDDFARAVLEAGGQRGVDR